MKFNTFFRSHFGVVSMRAIIVLAVFIGLLLLLGDHGTPRVSYIGEQSFSPQKGQFLFRFSRLMDQKSVERGFSISPQLPGKMSWSGRTFAYTPDEAIAYNQSYVVSFKQAYDADQRELPSQSITIVTAPYRFAYLGTEGDETGRILQYTLAGKEKMFITSADLFVQSFEISPDGNYIAFLGAKRDANLHDRKVFDLYLYNLKLRDQRLIPTDENWSLDNIRWLPDSQGLGVTFVATNGIAEGIVLYDIATEQWTPVAKDNARGYAFHFSPDGSQLVYVDTNGALILGSIPDGKGALIATTWTDSVGFDDQGRYFAYTGPRSASPFDITNVPILVGNGGEEIKIPVPESSNFDTQFIPNASKLVWTLETATGNLRDDHLAIYDYDQHTLTTIAPSDQASDFMPMPSPDGKLISWLRFYNDNKGYVISGWNDFQAKLMGGEIWIYDMITTQPEQTSLVGANVRFIP
jgi:Tol biopolymer transport system component